MAGHVHPFFSNCRCGRQQPRFWPHLVVLANEISFQPGSRRVFPFFFTPPLSLGRPFLPLRSSSSYPFLYLFCHRNARVSCLCKSLSRPQRCLIVFFSPSVGYLLFAHFLRGSFFFFLYLLTQVTVQPRLFNKHNSTTQRGNCAHK